MVSIFASTILLSNAADPVKEPLVPVFENSAKGLEMQCTPVKAKFKSGETVTLRCLVTNTTDKIKPLVAFPSINIHYRLVQDGTPWTDGQGPEVEAYPHDGIEVGPGGFGAEQIYYIPPHSWLQLNMTFFSLPKKFKGKLIYDPVVHGGGFFGDDAIEKAKQACVFSNHFEYETEEPETLQ